MSCVSCGKNLDEDDNFCRNCGVQVLIQDIRVSDDVDWRPPFVLGEISDEIHTMKLSVISTILESDDNGLSTVLTLNLNVQNTSPEDFSSIETTYAIFSPDGIPLGTHHQVIDEALLSGESSDYETKIVINTIPLDGDNRGLMVAVSAIASNLIVLKAGICSFSTQGRILNHFGLQDIANSIRSLGGFVKTKQICEVDELECLFLIENNSDSFFPRVDLILQVSHDVGITAAASSSEQVGPYEIKAIGFSKILDRPIATETVVEVSVAAHRLCSAGRCVFLLLRKDGKFVSKESTQHDLRAESFAEDFLTKNEFLDRFSSEFSGDDETGYEREPFVMTAGVLRLATNGLFQTIRDVELVLADPEKNRIGIAKLHHLLMAFLFSDGEELQLSFEEEKVWGRIYWSLHFGEIKIDQINHRLIYYKVRLDKNQSKNEELLANHG